MSERDPHIPPATDARRDDALIALFHDHYRPAARDALQRAAFTRQVMQRVPASRRWGWPSLVTAGTAACLALWLAYARAPLPATAGANGATLFALVEEETRPANDSEFLPDDYALLATDLDQ
ncbi:MAG: hypothetical protein SF182_06615 [Deltaproteobacteria bacterium]|nr:hypothetical protein [Deltaproteobacteria bacterium]